MYNACTLLSMKICVTNNNKLTILPKGMATLKKDVNVGQNDLNKSNVPNHTFNFYVNLRSKFKICSFNLKIIILNNGMAFLGNVRATFLTSLSSTCIQKIGKARISIRSPIHKATLANS